MRLSRCRWPQRGYCRCGSHWAQLYAHHAEKGAEIPETAVRYVLQRGAWVSRDIHYPRLSICFLVRNCDSGSLTDFVTWVQSAAQIKPTCEGDKGLEATYKLSGSGPVGFAIRLRWSHDRLTATAQRVFLECQLLGKKPMSECGHAEALTVSIEGCAGPLRDLTLPHGACSAVSRSRPYASRYPDEWVMTLKQLANLEAWSDSQVHQHAA